MILIILIMISIMISCFLLLTIIIIIVIIVIHDSRRYAGGSRPSRSSPRSRSAWRRTRFKKLLKELIKGVCNIYIYIYIYIYIGVCGSCQILRKTQVPNVIHKSGSGGVQTSHYVTPPKLK